MSAARRALPCALLLALSTACLDPLLDDDMLAPDSILPPGSRVPAWEDDAAAAAQLQLLDGVDSPVARRSGFYAGAPAHFWDFGEAPTRAAPIYILHEPSPNGPIALASHGAIIDAMPGDPGYSPFWQIWRVLVTDRYTGEILPSVDAIQQAAQRGLVETAQPTDLYVNCPVVHRDVRIVVDDAGTAIGPSSGYAQGREVHYFDFDAAVGPHQLDPTTGSVAAAGLYRLRREGGAPLDEEARGVDMTGDGDLTDSNDIFERGPAATGYSPLSQFIDVTIPATSESIDTAMDETQAEFRDAAQLFDEPGPSRRPRPGSVVAYQVGDTLRNLPMQIEGGTP